MLLLALACTPAPDDSATPTVEAPYLLDDGSAEEVSFDQAAIEDAITEAIQGARNHTADPAIDAYALTLANATEDCPRWYQDSTGLDYWYDTCETDDGAGFSGYGYYLDYAGYSDGTYVWDGPAIYAVSTNTTPDGDAFTGSGSALSLVGTGSDGDVTYTIYYTIVSGDFTWDGPGADGTWLEGDTPFLAGWVTDYGGIHAAYFDGSLPLAEGGAFDIAVLREATISAPEAGWVCPGEMAGSVSVHTAEGVWYEVLFDGDSSDSATCDQCGDVWHEGVSLGQACADASAWLDWDQTPW